MLRAVLTALILGAAAPAWGGGPLQVVTTTTDLRDLVQAVGGDRVSVEHLAPPGQDPHAVEVKPGQLARLESAALLVRIGLDHEPWLPRVLRGLPGGRFAPGSPENLDASRGIALLETETARVRPERGAHVHGFGNTHYWLDPENARPITASMVNALSRLSPPDRQYFEAQRREFLRRLDLGLERWLRAMAPYRGTRIVVVHESWPYFAQRFGLVIVAAVEPTPGVPPSPASLAALIQKMREGRIPLLIAEPYSNPSVVSQVAARSGARAVALISSVGADPEARDYLALFDLNIKRLTEALRPAR